MNSKSCYIFFTNTMIAGICIYAQMLKLSDAHAVLNILMTFLNIYFVISFFLSIYGIILGVKESLTRNTNFAPIIGIVGNTIYFLIFLAFIIKIWPQLMGI